MQLNQIFWKMLPKWQLWLQQRALIDPVKTYIHIFLYLISFFSLLLMCVCVSARRTCRCLAKTAGEFYFCHFYYSPFFSLPPWSFLPLVFSLLSGGSFRLSVKTNNQIQLMCINRVCPPERTSDWQAFLDHQHDLHILFESCEDASVGLVVLSVLSMCEGGGGGGVLLECSWCVSDWLWPAKSWGCCPWCWKLFCPFQFLSLYRHSSLPFAWLWIHFCSALISTSQPFHCPQLYNPLSLIPSSFSFSLPLTHSGW